MQETIDVRMARFAKKRDGLLSLNEALRAAKEKMKEIFGGTNQATNGDTIFSTTDAVRRARRPPTDNENTPELINKQQAIIDQVSGEIFIVQREIDEMESYFPGTKARLGIA